MKYLLLTLIFILVTNVVAWECDGTSFAVMSDSRSQYNEFKITLEFVKNFDINFIVFPGDMNTVEENKKIVDSMFNIPSYWVVGNHELERNDVQYIKSIFPSLKNVVSSYDETTYSFEYPYLHLIVTNQYIDSSEGNIKENSALFNWIKNDLEATDKSKQIFVTGHEPAYPHYRHIGNSLDQFPSDRDAFWKLLDDNSVEAFFNGHTHYYSKDDIHLDVTQIDSGNARLIHDGSTIILACVKNETNITVFQSTSKDKPFLYKESYIVNNKKGIVKEKDRKLNIVVILILIFLLIILISQKIKIKNLIKRLKK